MDIKQQKCVYPEEGDSSLTMLFLFWVIHFPPTEYEEAILYPITQKIQAISNVV